MTVKELMERLSNLPEDFEVKLWTPEAGSGKVNTVEVDNTEKEVWLSEE